MPIRYIDEAPVSKGKVRFLDDESAPQKPVSKEPPAYGGMEGARRFLVGGPTSYLTAPGSEDVLPMAGQTVGSLGGFGGSVAGATAGQGARQLIRGIRGYGEPLKRSLFDDFKGAAVSGPSGMKGPVRDEIATTGVIEGTMRGVPRALFPMQFGGKARELAGRKLGEIAENVTKKAPFAQTAKKPLIDEIDVALKDAPFERGPAIQALANAKKKLSDLGGPLTFDKARQLEQQLGREAQFASDATQGHFIKAPKAPRLNAAIKGLRSRVSGKVDEMAAQAGYPEFEGASKKFGELAKKYPESELQKMYSPTGQFLRGAIFGGGAAVPLAFGGGPLTAVAAPIAAWANIPPRYKTAIFRKLVDTPGGRASGEAITKVLSELGRKVQS